MDFAGSISRAIHDGFNLAIKLTSGELMEFRIADTFTESLTKLTGEEQKLAKTTAFDSQLNPANPGMQIHKLDGARSPQLVSPRQPEYSPDCASGRLNSDLRWRIRTKNHQNSCKII